MLRVLLDHLAELAEEDRPLGAIYSTRYRKSRRRTLVVLCWGPMTRQPLGRRANPHINVA